MSAESKIRRPMGRFGPRSVSTTRFSVDFSFPVYFTEAVFDPANRVLLDVVDRFASAHRPRVFLVIDGNVASARPELGAMIRRYFDAHSDEIEQLGSPLLVTGGEASKDGFSRVMGVMEHLNAVGIDRHSFIVVIGGGAVLDMVCFAAAIVHRGIRTIRMPTTVLSQADSGIGVKNGVNLFGKKNFAGTFVPPCAVINDSKFLESLSRRDKIAGLAESVKVALIRDRDFFEFLESNADALAKANPALMSVQIRRTAQLHMTHICTSGDPFELGSARPLDFGHWAAHKLESMTQHRLRHGEAVAIGMAIDLTYSWLAGYFSEPCLARALALLERLGFDLWDDALAQTTPDGRSSVMTGIEEFREHLGGTLHITLVREIGHGFEVHEMHRELIAEAIERLASRAADRTLAASNRRP